MNKETWFDVSFQRNGNIVPASEDFYCSIKELCQVFNKRENENYAPTICQKKQFKKRERNADFATEIEGLQKSDVQHACSWVTLEFALFGVYHLILKPGY